MSYVYFLGAGFSAAYGLPVMNEFFRVARENKLIKDDEKKFLAEVQRFAHMGVRLVAISRNNMEEILSFLEMAEQAGQIPQRLSDSSILGGNSVRSTELLKSIIARVYGPLHPSHRTRFSFLNQRAYAMLGFGSDTPTSWFPPSQVRNFPPSPSRTLTLPNRQSSTFITTNYDLCLETQLLSIHPQLKCNLAGDWESADGHLRGKGDANGIYDPNSNVQLLRLHGAVNWTRSEQTIGGVKCNFRVTAHVNPGNGLPWGIDESMYDVTKPPPILVAPTVFKHQADGPYAEHWREAAKALASATQLVFIGYSFPESDAYMRYFLGASLAENVVIEAIHIIDPHADAIAQGLKDKGHYGAHFLDLLRPYKRCWHIQ